MATQITVSYKKNDYILEFSRTTAAQIEDQGFVLDQISEKPVKMIPMLVYGAFLKHNRGIKRSLVDEIYENLIGKAGPVNILRNLFFSKGDYSKVRHQPPKKHWTKLHSYRAKVRWAQSRKELTQGSKVTNIEATTYISIHPLYQSIHCQGHSR